MAASVYAELPLVQRAKKGKDCPAMTPFRNSTLPRPIAIAAVRGSSIPSVISTPTTWRSNLVSAREGRRVKPPRFLKQKRRRCPKRRPTRRQSRHRSGGEDHQDRQRASVKETLLRRRSHMERGARVPPKANTTAISFGISECAYSRVADCDQHRSKAIHYFNPSSLIV
jgi:hypothetical protein